MIDPYREWLGISEERRPPTLYQLLGLSPGTSDPGAIEAAANRQFAKVQSLIAGSHAKEAWRIIDEITLAKNTLLDPAKRSAYDMIFGFGPKRPALRPAAPPPPLATANRMEWEQPATLPTAPLPTAPLPTAYAPVPTRFVPPAPREAPPPVFAPLPAARPAAPAPVVNLLDDDDDLHRHDDSSSQGLPTPAAMPKPRSLQRKRSGMVMVGGGIIALGLIGGVIYLAARDKGSNGESKDVAGNNDKKGGAHPTPTPLDPEPKTNDKDAKDRKKDKDKKKENLQEKKKTPPKPPDPPPLLEVAFDFKESKLFRGHDSRPLGIAVSPDGKLLLSAGDDMRVFTWSPATDKGSLRKNLMTPASGAAILPNGKEIIVADETKIYQIDLVTNKEIKSWSSPQGGGNFTALALSSDGKHIVTSQSNGLLFWWDTDKSDFTKRIEASTMRIECVALTTDAKTILAGDVAGAVLVMEGPSGKLIKKWKGHPGGVSAVACSPDGKLLTTAGADKLVKVWDRGTLMEVCSLKGHAGVPTSIAWTTDSAIVLTGAIDKTIRAWDSATGMPLRWSFTASEKVWSVAVDPKDRFAIAGLGDGGLQLVFLPSIRPDYPPRGTWVQAPRSPPPAPLPYLIETSTKAVREKYKADFARTAPDDQLALFEKLLGRAKVAPDDSTTRYAMFLEARDLAVRIGRIDEAFKAIETSAIWFEIDDLAEKASALQEAAKGMVTRPIVEAAFGVVDQAEKLARPDIVDDLMRARELFPQLPDAADLTLKIQAIEKRWTAAAADRDEGKRLTAEYLKAPESAPTNLASGKHLCFRLGQWRDGLPRLVKGDDAPLKELATKDQAAPKDGKGQVELAVAWRDYAAKADETSKAGALLRAKFWFDQAVRGTDLAPGDKLSASARIQEINRQIDTLPNQPANKGGLPVKRQQFNSIRTGLALETQWALTGSDGLSPEGLLFKGEGSLASRFRMLDSCNVEFAFIPDGREVTIQVNGASASFKPEAAATVVFTSVERKGTKVQFSLKNFTGAPIEEKSANLMAGTDDAAAISFKVAGASDKDGLLMKTIVVYGMVRPVD